MSKKEIVSRYGSNLPEQSAYAYRVREEINKRFAEPPKAFIHTYGCQQNVSDSERIKGMLESLGYTLTESGDDADFVLFNTCAVRAHAEDRVFGNVGVLKHNKEKNPDMIIAVSGCMTAQDSVAMRFKRSFPYVDIVFGTAGIHRLPEFIYRKMVKGERVFENKQDEAGVVEDIPVHRDGDIKGWLPIMYGCNNFCTYCIVPYVRGRERSRLPEDIIKEAKELINSGVREITLLGQNVNSYGKGAEHGVNFAKLLRMINDLDGDFRIRFMTSHPKDCTEELLLAMSECEKVCHHLHLPVQSGSDRILKEMNRHYDTEGYLKLIKRGRELMPDMTFTSDIIVGFPGETEEDFKQTLELIKIVRYNALFTFIYSPREGTPAAKMIDPISREEKGKWFTEMLKVQEKIADENAFNMIGRETRVICEENGKTAGTLNGRSSENTVIEFEADESLIGSFRNVIITDFDGNLKGKLSEE